MAANTEKLALPEGQDGTAEHQTDSYGSKSDNSGKSIAITVPGARQKMEIVCVIDLHNSTHLSERKKAFEEAKQSCSQINTDYLVHHIQVTNVVLKTTALALKSLAYF